VREVPSDHVEAVTTDIERDEAEHDIINNNNQFNIESHGGQCHIRRTRYRNELKEDLVLSFVRLASALHLPTSSS
jgi:hypothetical protein